RFIPLMFAYGIWFSLFFWHSEL
ncbi:uncharacterized protein METZ01_LOCUS285568, partial [marine metagenome]